MLGQWPPGGVDDFGAGAGVVDLGAGVVGVGVVGAAAAPDIPAAAPPPASAPATIVAPSSLAMRLGEPPGVGAGMLHPHYRARAKCGRTSPVGVV
jgi:hypothetical protein